MEIFLSQTCRSGESSDIFIVELFVYIKCSDIVVLLKSIKNTHIYKHLVDFISDFSNEE